MKRIPLAVCAAVTLLLPACSSTPVAMTYYDFGASAKSSGPLKCNLPPIFVADIAAPDSLDSNLMSYRLLYVSDQQMRSYATYRWSMPPAQLLTERIKTQLAGNGVTVIGHAVNKTNATQLRIELDSFSQNFSDAAHSYSQLQLRATLVRGSGLIGQTTLRQKADASAATAPAGAAAMRVASDALIENLNDWLCKQLPT